MGMILNIKYKCPVCSLETFTLKNKYHMFNHSTTIQCSNCKSDIGFEFTSNIVTASIGFLALASFSITQNGLLLIILFITEFIIIVYDVLYSDLKHLLELEQYIPEEPAFNLSEFLDGLRNQGGK